MGEIYLGENDVGLTAAMGGAILKKKKSKRKNQKKFKFQIQIKKKNKKN